MEKNPYVTDDEMEINKHRPINLLDSNYLKSFENATCTACGAKITGFKDELSRKEYAISGLCQTCQDEVFAPPEGEKSADQ